MSEEQYYIRNFKRIFTDERCDCGTAMEDPEEDYPEQGYLSADEAKEALAYLVAKKLNLLIRSKSLFRCYSAEPGDVSIDYEDDSIWCGEHYCICRRYPEKNDLRDITVNQVASDDLPF